MGEVELKQSLFLVMGSLFHSSRQYLDEQFEQYGLTRNEWLILALLRVHQGRITQQFAKSYMGIENSYFTKVLNELEHKKFIVREIDPDDRRNRIIKIHPTPPQHIKKIYKTIHDLNDTIQRDLNEKELRDLHGFLSTISKRLEELR